MIDELRMAGPIDSYPVSNLNGPGQRWVLWVQGCVLLCTKTCLNPELLDADGGYTVLVSEVLETLHRVREENPDLEGITLMGGEPFDQAGPLAELAASAHAMGLSVMTYSGWTLENLLRRGPVGTDRLLAATDLLLDGPFVAERFSPNLLWRGSNNQRLILLSDRYSRDQIDDEVLVKGIDVSFEGSTFQITGGQDPVMLTNIIDRLRSRGFNISETDQSISGLEPPFDGRQGA